ncbi:hypothetical protein HK101_010623 [Irineochytrium annulatum]|nr:hypothetical protein HK101_010623 [Irineochytrium annulatum]
MRNPFLWHEFVLTSPLWALVNAANPRDDEEEDSRANAEFLKTMSEEIRKSGGAKASSELRFSHTFPENPKKVVVSGEFGLLNIGVLNTGKGTNSLFAVSGQFTQPKNYSLPIRNITASRINLQLEPNRDGNVPFKFRAELEAQDVGLVVFLDYFDKEDNPHRVIAYKGQIKITPSDSYFDFQGILLMLGLAAGSYYGVKYLYRTYFPETVVKKARPSKAKIQEEIEAKKDVLSDEWIPEHLKKGSASPKKGAKKE